MSDNCGVQITLDGVNIKNSPFTVSTKAGLLILFTSRDAADDADDDHDNDD
jgi:hypothetical protein